jgi:hypothetical protein
MRVFESARSTPCVFPANRGFRGAERIRTAVRGFAGLCLTTRPPRPARQNRSDVGCQELHGRLRSQQGR